MKYDDNKVLSVNDPQYGNTLINFTHGCRVCGEAPCYCDEDRQNQTVSDIDSEPKPTHYPEFEGNIIQWALDRNIINGGSIEAQLAKLDEELQELKDALAVNDQYEVIDAIGDCTVVLCIIAAMRGAKFSDCQRQAWNEIKDRKGKLINGIFVKDAK